MVFRRNRNLDAKASQLCPHTGRNLSDNTHPDYDPATDPELREQLSLSTSPRTNGHCDENSKRR
jgi:phospholipid-translocating ATPase